MTLNRSGQLGSGVNGNLSKSNLIRLVALVILFTVVVNVKLLSIIVSSEDQSSVKSNIAQADLQFDAECDDLGEWESLGRHYYFKRTAAFYFADASFLRLNFIADHSITQARFSLDLALSNRNRTHAKTRLSGRGIQLSIQRIVHEYNLMQLDAFFNVSRFLLEHEGPQSLPLDPNVLRLSVWVSEHLANTTTTRALSVNVKRLKNDEKHSTKKTALICGKCFRFNKTVQNGRLLKWWFELNQKAGYDNIVICNHSIDSRFWFSNYKDFLIFTKLTCIPNLQGINGRKYLHSNLNLKDHANGEYNAQKYDIINQLVVNECYLTYFDKYKYIAVLEPDEAVLPKKTRLFTLQDEMSHMSRIGQIHNTKLIQKEQIFDKVQCERYQNDSATSGEFVKSDLDAYLAELSQLLRQNSSPGKSFYFSRAIFLRNDLVQSIFRALNHFFMTTKFNQSMPVNYIVGVAHRDATTNHIYIEFDLTISGQAELDYAKGLFKIHKHIIRSYLTLNKNLFMSMTQQFNRFFIIADGDGFGSKTIHDTRRTFELSLYRPLRFVKNMRLVTEYENVTRALSYTRVPLELGHVSHFQSVFRLSKKQVSVSQLRLDLNYVNCYFRPTVSRLALEREAFRIRNNQNRILVNNTKQQMLKARTFF